MAKPVGESSWLAYIDESLRNVSDIEQRVNAVELYKRAVGEEPGSLKLWLAYCDYFWSLWESSHDNDSSWPEEERLMGQELFSFSAALDLWEQGYEAIKYRVGDSNNLWDRWISLEKEELSKNATSDGIKRITHLYRERLTTPHLTWDDTSQKLSEFLSEYDRDAWEESMRSITNLAQDAKRIMSARDHFETKINQFTRQDNLEMQKTVMMEYLEWETLQSKLNRKDPSITGKICVALYERALSGILATDEAAWCEYIVFLSSQPSLCPLESLLDANRRGVHHCPWSGRLWSRYILCAEESKLPFTEVEAIKHTATSENQLYNNGMDSMIDMYEAWCGFLKRTAMNATITDEAVDVADVGLKAALEDVEVVGQRLYGKEFQGDPKFRLERIYIQYLTERKNAVDEARAQWQRLAAIQIHADSHDFWLRYYMWEMAIFSSNRGTDENRTPTLATAVLRKASSRRTIDWPEKALEIYLQHCNDYEVPFTVRMALDSVQRATKAINKRREREQLDQAAAYAAYYATSAAEGAAATGDDGSPAAAKRKLDHDQDDAEIETSAKRPKNEHDGSAGDPNKRDREHSTIIVSNLPVAATQTKVRQYFKDYGHINNITAFVHEDDGQSTTALIEFSSADEAKSALLRDMKYFGESQIQVRPGDKLTIYVANYPPAADEKYIRALFETCGRILSIRWPSLKVNTHRRFCYISFRDEEAAAKAVQMDGTVLDETYKLLSKYSDPGRKKNREGSVAEGREVRVTNLDPAATDSDVKEAFAKYGTVTRVNIPRGMSGKARGFAFIDFETKEQAEEAASQLSNTKFLQQILHVEISKASKVKVTARSNPMQDAEGDSSMADGGNDGQSQPTSADISARTISLMGLPDTVNDARVLALVEPLGRVVKLTLQPSRGGAIIEFADAATAGKAALNLDAMDYEGYKLRTGTADELRHAKAENNAQTVSSKSQSSSNGKGATNTPAPKSFMPPPSSIRRPAVGRAGPKRGLGFAPRKPGPSSATQNGSADAAGGDGKQAAPKSNADFKAMFLASGDKGKSGEENQESADTS